LKRIQAKGSVLWAFGATAASLALLVMWTRELSIGWLAASIPSLSVGALLLAGWLRRSAPTARARRGSSALLAAQGLLVMGIVAAAASTWQFQRTEGSWPDVVDRRQAAVGAALSDRVSDLVARGQAAGRRAAIIAARPRPPGGEIQQTAALFRDLADLRAELRVDAIAIYTDAGNLVAWAGQHRGSLPDSIWVLDVRAYFEERPLFSYLYFPVPVPGRAEHAIAAVLVETGVLSDGGDLGVAVGTLAGARTWTRASFRKGGGDAVWGLVADGDTVVSARLDPLRQQEWRRALDRSARRMVLLAAATAFILLSAGWLRATAGLGWPAMMPLLVLLPLAGAAPLSDALGLERFFSPLLFTLPLGRDVSLGRLLAVLLPAVAFLVAVRRSARPVRRVLLHIAAGAALVAVAYPLLLRLLLDGATTTLVHGGSAYWLGLQLTAALLLGVVTLFAMPSLRRTGQRDGWLGEGRRPVLLAAAMIAAAMLALYASSGAHPYERIRLELAAAWSLPFALAALGLASLGGRTGALARWIMAGWLASTAVLPNLWVAHVDARLQVAEGELETLGTRADPFLEFLLVNFGREAVARFDAGEDGVQLLYRTWVASGLAQEPYPAHIVLWSPAGFPEVQLGSAPPPTQHEVDRLLAIVDGARDGAAPGITPFSDLPNMSRLLTVPMADGSLITVRVPPRRTLDRPSAIAPFLGAVTAPSARLNLVEVSGPEPSAETIEWARTPGGWRSEATVKYPDGWYHAHLAITLPGSGILVARATLLLTFNLLVFTLVWVIGVVARGGAAVPRSDWTGWLGSFRARVTLALFGFFLVPTAGFGWVAYSALAGEVARAAQTVAQHSVAQAVREFQEGAGDLRDLAAHAGTDILRFQGGELIDVSSREALDLGVYNAWLPPHVHQRLESGEELDALEMQTLGDHSYVTAYRSLRPSGTLGVPMSLSAGDTAIRQREFAHLVLFAAVVGALLSLALSVAVGRALAGPIGQLRRASAAVGAGRLVRLPDRAGEFGQLFASFNRMTRRLRRARARELRTARVLAWGEMARQVAHEIKNPLTPIKLSVQHLRRAHADRHPQFDDILDTNVSQVLAEIDRLSDIARAFSRYGAPALDTGPLAAVDAAAVIRETLLLYRSGASQIRYEEEVEPGLPPVRARSNELKEVLLNLVENSRSALDGTGTVTVRAALRDDRVEIDVADDGPGIPADLLPRIFEPHFSTRSSGTGLGLAIVRRLVESWDGSVTADSEEGGGTVVRIRLALASRSRSEGDGGRPATESGS
jgi:signal transduction histidine kinase